MTGQSPKRRIFISYSHEPKENAEFVRSLARQLSKAGFEVWLDEERIAAGEDIEAQIKSAIEAADVGLFVVTSRWLKRDRDWIRHEATLFGQRPGTRRLVLLREPAGDGDLGPYFATLKRLEWFPDDPRPVARFWEVYCGITGQAPGPRDEWDERGRQVLGSDVGPPPPLPEKPKSGTVKLSCTGKPIASFAGDDWTFLVTDRDEWAGLRANGELHPPIERVSDFAAAAVTAANGLLVAGYDSTVARLRGPRWDILKQEAPVLCFASGPDGDLAGTTSGGVALLSGTARPAFRMRDPVMSMAAYDGGLLVLGSRGMFGRVSWPVASREPLKWIQTGDLGRPIAFFQTVETNQIGVVSATRAGVIDPETESLVICPRTFDEGIRELVFLGAQSWPYAILTDAGTVMMMDANLTSARLVRFPRGTVVAGCAGASSGMTLAWTVDGRLYRISSQAIAEVIAEEGVVLAYSPAGTDSAHVVRWNSERGATVELKGIH